VNVNEKAMLADELLPRLDAYFDAPDVRVALGLPRGAELRLAFLAQGEYNINYVLEASDGFRRVVRVNVGTQIGQAGGAQVAYEAAALRLLGPHRVAPRLDYLDDRLDRLPFGLLVMEFLPGAPLRYTAPEQIAAAAACLARLHQIPAPAGAPFIRRRALLDDLAEAREWLAPYLACERAPVEIRRLFERLLAHAEMVAARNAAHFPPPFALVHTDVQAHNFVVDDRAGLACTLVDWERPLIDDPSYDLAHFLLPTTTRWKCGYTFSAAEREHFLAAYCAARKDLAPDDVRARLELRWPFILLRALGWCAGAWVDYTGTGRAISNQDTLRAIESYLQPGELRALFGEWLRKPT
jgi:Ser/Thr protein kinase RdoA (MazF antagonist)